MVRLMGKGLVVKKPSEVGVHLIDGKCILLTVFSGLELYFQVYLGGKRFFLEFLHYWLIYIFKFMGCD